VNVHGDLADARESRGGVGHGSPPERKLARAFSTAVDSASATALPAKC
jgi:hypothetical protein